MAGSLASNRSACVQRVAASFRNGAVSSVFTTAARLIFSFSVFSWTASSLGSTVPLNSSATTTPSIAYPRRSFFRVSCANFMKFGSRPSTWKRLPSGVQVPSRNLTPCFLIFLTASSPFGPASTACPFQGLPSMSKSSFF